MAMIGLRYDLRAPSWGSATHAEMYAACLEQSRWGDERGLDFVVLSEHHGAEDGYIPAPVTMAAAIAGHTRRIGINIAAILVPLHDPVRLAEELAVLDLASGGRVSFVAGTGYRYEEFEMAGVDRKQPGGLLEEYVAVMRKAWAGEAFECGAHAFARCLRVREQLYLFPRVAADIWVCQRVGDARRNTALRLRRGGDGNGGNGQCGSGAERHQCLLHGLTFLVGSKGP